MDEMTSHLNVLTISDRVSDYLYHPDAGSRFPDVDVILSCGDLPYYYVEFVQDALKAPLYFVRGNHAPATEFGETIDRHAPLGGIDLHRKCTEFRGLLMAGFEGSLRYREGAHQYTQAEMWAMVISLVPRLLVNRLLYGRWLDILVTHSPPWKINDGEDRAHQGFKALRWLLDVFQPRFHFHGHMHVLGSNQSVVTRHQATQVINTYGYRRTRISLTEGADAGATGDE